MLKPFAIEFQPFIDDITRKEKTVQECADMATMERVRGLFVYITIGYITSLQQMLMMAQGPRRRLRRWRSFSLTCERI